MIARFLCLGRGLLDACQAQVLTSSICTVPTPNHHFNVFPGSDFPRNENHDTLRGVACRIPLALFFTKRLTWPSRPFSLPLINNGTEVTPTFWASFLFLFSSLHLHLACVGKLCWKSTFIIGLSFPKLDITRIGSPVLM